jgi:hypothetical protein
MFIEPETWSGGSFELVVALVLQSAEQLYAQAAPFDSGLRCRVRIHVAM